MRSVAGCLTCRRRKLKCDEAKPECGQCRKAARVCEPGEIVFRHQQNSSLNHNHSSRRSTLDKYYSNRNSFSHSDTWLAVPEQVTFVTVDPANDRKTHEEATSPSELSVQDASLEANQSPHQDGNIATEQQESPAALATLSSKSPEDPRSQPSVQEHGVGRSSLPQGSPDNLSPFPDITSPGYARPPHNIDFMLNPVAAGIDLNRRRESYSTALPRAEILGSVDPYVASPQSQTSRASETVGAVETDPNTAFLLRHFSEHPGKWLDLYFLDGYFALDVPMKALAHPLLKFAACAYAAKHLDRTRGKTDTPRPPVWHLTVATTTTWPNSDAVDWAWHSANYYSQAINLLRETLQQTHDIGVSPDQHSSPSGGDDIRLMQHHIPYADISDETLAAMAILCNFEFMSASDTEWTRHLSGTMLVWDLRQAGVISLMNSRPSKARKAIFWNLFRQDVYAACILECRTRLDMENISMYRAAGLELDDQGLVLPSTGDREGIMKEDMISNGLIWILAKVFDYIETAKEAQRRADDFRLDDQPERPTRSMNDSLWALQDRWKAISHELDVWYAGLPDSFRPCARIERSASEPATASSPPKPATIPEIWFTNHMCASSIQTYHMARMLLLVHRPQSSEMVLHTGAISDFIHLYRTIEAEIRYRSREIFGIALSSPTTSIMLHQTQTIFLAAQCLSEDEERRMALDMLRRVNSDLGWETGYRIQQLLHKWGWKEE